MNYSFDITGNVLKVALDGRLVAACTEEFQNQGLAHRQNADNILLDLSKMSHIDSSGLGSLVFLLQKAQSWNGTVKLACIQPRPRIIFEITKVYRVFDSYDTGKAAMESFLPEQREKPNQN